MGKRVLEAVANVGRVDRLVQKFGFTQICKSATKLVLL